MHTKHLLMVIVVSLGALATGCVQPGGINEDLIYRYQQLAVQSGPQPRLGGLIASPGLDGLRPVSGATGEPLKVTKDEKTGQTLVLISLEESVYRALLNNLDIRAIGYDPAIARQDVITAAAAFDAVFFASYEWDKTDRPSANVFVSSQNRTDNVQAGVKALTVTGAQASLTYSFVRSESATTTAFSSLNPNYTQNTALKITQPLLRDFGPDVNLAQLRVARKNHAITLSQFHAKVLDVILEVQTLYWQLVRARQEYDIQEQLLQMTVDTLEKVKARSGLDATPVQIKQAEAAVASRRATLIQAKKNIGDVQDRLVRDMADASITVLDSFLLIPTTDPGRVKLTVDRADQVAAALKHSPELEQARIAIAINDIRVKVAKNQTLPRLDVTASTGTNGLARGFGDSFDMMTDGNFIDYILGASFEYPLGNRAAVAQLRKTELDRSKSIVALQGLADIVAINVNDAIRQLENTFAQIEADREAVDAGKAQLKAIEDREEFKQALTPEFLQVKLQAQENLAAAERAELQAVVDYNTAQATLARATGLGLQDAKVKITDAGEDFVRMLSGKVKLPELGAPSGGPGGSTTTSSPSSSMPASRSAAP